MDRKVEESRENVSHPRWQVEQAYLYFSILSLPEDPVFKVPCLKYIFAILILSHVTKVNFSAAHINIEY